ncbi:MAG: Fur family transcriptional regulator [Dehalococcoidia bacterium]|nr:Fur family transcriptional regulator [Dehalococcoidia bacterium]
MYIQRAIDLLRVGGHRITQSRREVLKALDQADRPMSPYELQKLLLAEGRHLDHVTIYRTLELLCDLNLAHRVSSLGGFVRCSLDDTGACHRYMVCRRCGAFLEFADESLCQKEEEAVRSFGFHTEQHIAESLGICANCRVQGAVR